MSATPATHLRFCLLPLLALLLPACQGPGLVGGRGHSTYGDRPGAVGFTTVVIDAGHGGKDSGAPGRIRGMPEKTAALDIAKRLQSALRPTFRTSMTRSSDTFVPLDSRVAAASRSGNAVLVSIHLNSGPRRVSGPETYWWRVDSYSLARRVQTALKSATGNSSSRGLVRRRLRLTRNPEIPCILVECGYLSNASEAARLAQPAYRERLAQAIARAIREQALLGDAGAGPLPRPIYAPPSSAHDARE
jgi:N-acetylmuramoyl-L-alanine amidase